MQHEAALNLREVCLAAGLAFLCSVANADQAEPTLFVDVDGRSVTIIASDRSLKDVLEAVALRTGLIVYSNVALDQRVSFSITETGVPGLFRRILKDRNFVLHYVSDGATGQPVFGSRLWIFANDSMSAAQVWSAGVPAPEWTLRYTAGDPEKIRFRAISNIATWQDDSELNPDLLVALRDPAVAVREEAVRVLGEYHLTETEAYLRDALYDPESRVRIAAIEALAVSGSDDAALILTPLHDDRDAGIRMEVIHAMAEIGGDVAHHYLRQALSDTSELNRETAAGYLDEIATTTTANRF